MKQVFDKISLVPQKEWSCSWSLCRALGMCKFASANWNTRQFTWRVTTTGRTQTRRPCRGDTVQTVQKRGVVRWASVGREDSAHLHRRWLDGDHYRRTRKLVVGRASLIIALALLSSLDPWLRQKIHFAKIFEKLAWKQSNFLVDKWS